MPVLAGKISQVRRYTAAVSLQINTKLQTVCCNGSTREQYGVTMMRQWSEDKGWDQGDTGHLCRMFPSSVKHWSMYRVTHFYRYLAMYWVLQNKQIKTKADNLPLYLYVLDLTQRIATTMMMITMEAAARATTNQTFR